MAAYPGLAKVVCRSKIQAGFDEFVDWYGLLISAEKCWGGTAYGMGCAKMRSLNWPS